MLRYRVKEPPPKYNFPGWVQKEAFVVLRAANQDSAAELEVEGDEDLRERVREAILQSTGVGGHAIEKWTTPRDLDIAMFSSGMKRFAAERIEGDQLFDAR